MSNQFDKSNVQDVYNQIAHHFDKTRAYLWKGVIIFLEALPKHSLVLDVGCGNGRNMADIFTQKEPYLQFIGSDFSTEFTDICFNKGLEVLSDNNLKLSMRDNIFDAVISIAVIHHLSKKLDRIKCVNELIRVAKPGGRIFIQVWAWERETGKKYHDQEQMIRWTLDNTYSPTGEKQVLERYYYLFKKGELDSYIDLEKVLIIDSYFEKNNWIIILEKK